MEIRGVAKGSTPYNLVSQDPDNFLLHTNLFSFLVRNLDLDLNRTRFRKNNVIKMS